MLILKGVCFDVLLQVLILNKLGHEEFWHWGQGWPLVFWRHRERPLRAQNELCATGRHENLQKRGIRAEGVSQKARRNNRQRIAYHSSNFIVKKK